MYPEKGLLKFLSVEVEDIATEDPKAVTCKKCWAVIRKTGILRSSKKGGKGGAG